MDYSESGYLSLIGQSLLEPIAALWERLEDRSKGLANEVQTSPPENGYSAAAVILIAVFMESALVRTGYILAERKPDNGRPLRSARAFFRSFCSDKALVTQVDEVFVIRDVIAHNHLWDCVVCDTDEGMKFTKPPYLAHGGDSKYSQTIDQPTRMTKKLRLNLFPTRIGRTDAKLVLRVAFDMAHYIENKDRHCCYMSHVPVPFRDRRITFSEFVQLATQNMSIDELSKMNENLLPRR